MCGCVWGGGRWKREVEEHLCMYHPHNPPQPMRRHLLQLSWHSTTFLPHIGVQRRRKERGSRGRECLRYDSLENSTSTDRGSVREEHVRRWVHISVGWSWVRPTLMTGVYCICWLCVVCMFFTLGHRLESLQHPCMHV